jgi:hypothetical protein
MSPGSMSEVHCRRWKPHEASRAKPCASVLDQQMAAREQAHHRETHHLGFAAQNPAKRLLHAGNALRRQFRDFGAAHLLTMIAAAMPAGAGIRYAARP